MKKENILEGTCKEIVLMMQDVIDGTASEDEAHAVKEHLLHCESCRRVFDDFRVIRRETAAIAAEPPCDLKDRIIKRITEEDRSAAIRRVRKRKKRIRGITGTLVAAAVIVFCLVNVSRYVTEQKSSDSLLSFAAMQDKSTTAGGDANESVSEDQSLMLESVEYDGLTAPEAGETVYENVYDRETILEDAKALLRTYAVQGMYAEVFYANVESLPARAEALNADPKGVVGIYKTEDFAAFVTENGVTVNGVQYEFTNGVEISSCGLEYGGAEVLVILVKR